MFAVVGGGVAGVTCAQELGRLCTKDDLVVVLSSERLVKRALVVDSISENLEDIQLAVGKGEEIFAGLENVTYLHCAVRELDPEKKMLVMDSGESMIYDELCICTGASPKSVLESDCVTTLRDTDSITSLCKTLEHCTSLMVVGNGGIALDIVCVGYLYSICMKQM